MTYSPLQHPERGFTLVETLVAIATLMVAIVGPYYSIQQAIVTSYAARDQLIGSSLAQEGEEYIYFRRDSNYLNSQDWLTGLDACRTDSPYNNTNGCAVDPAQNTISSCSSGGCSPLKLASNGLYTQASGNPDTRFTRTVTMQSLNANEVQVTVTVTWVTEHRNFSVSTTEDLYNWL